MIEYGSWALQTWPTGAARHIRLYSSLSIHFITQVKLKQAKQQIILALTNDQLVLDFFFKSRPSNMWQMVHHVTISDQIQFYTIQI